MGKMKNKKRAERAEWHRWFAWYPVCYTHGYLTLNHLLDKQWFKFVYRREVEGLAYGTYEWQYKPYTKGK